MSFRKDFSSGNIKSFSFDSNKFYSPSRFLNYFSFEPSSFLHITYTSITIRGKYIYIRILILFVINEKEK